MEGGGGGAYTPFGERVYTSGLPYTLSHFKAEWGVLYKTILHWEHTQVWK